MAQTKRIRAVAILAALLFSLTCLAQQRETFKYKWDVVPIDDRWDFITDSAATKLIRSYDNLMAPLYEVVGQSAGIYKKKRPESGLSNFVADAIFKKAQELDPRKIDLALTNFGGIRTSLPKGDITMYDIMSIFPFKNFIVVFDISGKEIIQLMEEHASRPEAMSGVKLVVDKGKITTLEVAGAPVDPDRTYVMASINFLMTGGDDFTLNRFAKNKKEYTEILVRDAIVSDLRKLAAEGKVLTLQNDGRTVVNK